MVDVGAHARRIHRAQVEAGGDALRELREVGGGDHVAQLRLADQHELHQVVLARVDVGEHPQLLERRAAEVLRLVEDEHHAAAGGVLVDQVGLEPREQVDVALFRLRRLVERQHGPAQDLAAVALGVGDHADHQILLHRIEQMVEQRGLAGPHLPGQQRDGRARHHPVLEHREGSLVHRAPEQERRVRDQREGPFMQVEVIGVETDGGTLV